MADADIDELDGDESEIIDGEPDDGGTLERPHWQMRIVGSADVPPDQLLANPFNWRVHPAGQQEALLAILDRIGWVGRVLVNITTQHVVDGHLRVQLALRRDEPTVPVDYVDLSDAEEKEMLLYYDTITGMAIPDAEKIKLLIADVKPQEDVLKKVLDSMSANAALLLGQVAAGNRKLDRAKAVKTLAERFLVPPFTIFDARQGYWVERKRAWLALGIASELGRGNERDKTKDGLVFHRSAQPVHTYKAKEAYDSLLGRKTAWEDYAAMFPETMAHSGTSVFDPVLCEIAYRWFSPPGGSVLDPFTGGSVRGIVAGMLGRHYTGIDLRAEQVAANDANWLLVADACEQGPGAANAESTGRIRPRWLTGDALEVQMLANGEYDFIFTCPPYADLERYSDDPRDLSTMDYAKFLDQYRAIIERSCFLLKPNRFAAIVVGEIRTKDKNGYGAYRNFVGDTVRAFLDAGMQLYNEAVLITQVGSTAIRVRAQFEKSRKLGKIHQNVLVFVKGDGRLATESCGKVDVFLPERDDENGDNEQTERDGE